MRPYPGILLPFAAITLVLTALGQTEPRPTVPATTRPGFFGPRVAAEPRVHDPSMIHAPDAYYVFSTGLGIPTYRSTDLRTFTRIGPAFAATPEWITKEIPRSFWIWAPDISFFNGQYHLYYCCSSFGKNRSIIALATSPTLNPDDPAYHWSDQGKIIESFTTDSFNAIDPSVCVDERGTPWLTFGSFWDGIHLRKLLPSGLPDPADATLYHLAARPHTPQHPIEGPCITRHGGAYFLFVSFDFCCRGVNSTYRIMVGRAGKITGPYRAKDGTPMLQGGATQLLAGDPHTRLRGPGGCSVLQDGDRYLLVHHFYDADEHGAAKLQVRPLTFSADNWPIVGEPINTPR